jgi:flagellar biosynthesis protein FlhA
MGTLSGIATTEPAFGLPAVWIDEGLRDEAESLSYTVVAAEEVIITHLTETIRRNVASLLTRQETKKLLDALKAENPAVVEEVVPEALTLGDVQRVLQALLREGVPIRDLTTILEAIGDRARQQIRDPNVLAEYARRDLSRMLVQPYLDDTRTLRAITLSPANESEVAASVTDTVDGDMLAMDPERAEALVNSIVEQNSLATSMGTRAVLICSGRIRRHVRRLLEQAAPTLPVIAYQEIPPGLRVEPLSQVV